jgi:hypothetical protein
MIPIKSADFFRWVERISVLVIVSAAVYIFLSFRDPPIFVNSPHVLSDEPGAVNVPEGPVNGDEGFSQLLTDRDLFNAPPLPTPVPWVEEPPPEPVQPPRDMELLPAQLKVVAVVVDGAVQVVIEDVNLKKTFFIEQGLEKDGFRIERIDGRKIFLSYYGTMYVIPFGR